VILVSHDRFFLDKVVTRIADLTLRTLTDYVGNYSDYLVAHRARIDQLRKAKRYKADLPVIIITGYSTESSAIEALNLGVAGYLTKPFRVPQVLAAAAKALGE